MYNSSPPQLNTQHYTFSTNLCNMTQNRCKWSPLTIPIACHSSQNMRQIHTRIQVALLITGQAKLVPNSDCQAQPNTYLSITSTQYRPDSLPKRFRALHRDCSFWPSQTDPSTPFMEDHPPQYQTHYFVPKYQNQNPLNQIKNLLQCHWPFSINWVRILTPSVVVSAPKLQP